MMSLAHIKSCDIGGTEFKMDDNLPYKKDTLSYDERARDLVSRMTLEEKVTQMLHQSPAIDRLGIPSYNWWNEALHGIARAGVATVFPQAIGLAASFNPQLVEKVCRRGFNRGQGEIQRVPAQGGS